MEPTGHDFWVNSGYRLLDINTQGHLRVTDDFLRHLLERPEIAPISDSCEAEQALHAQLQANPRSEVPPAQLQTLADRDAADNYAVWLRFRTRLMAQPTLEASYLALFQGPGVDVAPVLVAQLTQVLLRHILGPNATAMEARAAEMLFCTQKLSVLDDGVVMAADHSTVERYAVTGGLGQIGELLTQGGIALRSVDLDVLGTDNADLYWQRDSCQDMVVCLNHGQPALDALCRVLERWIAHFLELEVTVRTEREIEDAHWVWHVGLDAQASSILNDLYTGAEVSEDRMRRLMCLFRLEFANPSDMRAEVAGRPVYLAMAMDENKLLRLKPQNLLLNLPLARRS
ncbi:MAG: hypothetical protein CFE44_02840 [Burkholderiales bacterium PBB4]|nr:MAG: hypothetical protein CFE44_02840 [Burkholderiales bacterium PBB4]